MPSFTIRQYSGPESEAILPEIANVFREAFAAPPYENAPMLTEKFINDWPARARRPGFLFFGATADEATPKLTGFIYGWPSRRGDFWYDEFTKTLGDEAEFWLDDCFELVDLAVAPQAQGQGLGRRLLEELFFYVSARTAILLTHREETAASRLYERNGWKTIAMYEGARGHYRVLGKRLTQIRSRF